MRPTVRSAALALAFCLAAGSAFAQGSLRIGLGDDPDGLDPTTSRFYTTRIVFAALCDKLFDIDEKAGIVPAARARLRDLGRRQDRHDQASARREVP